LTSVCLPQCKVGRVFRIVAIDEDIEGGEFRLQRLELRAQHFDLGADLGTLPLQIICNNHNTLPLQKIAAIPCGDFVQAWCCSLLNCAITDALMRSKCIADGNVVVTTIKALGSVLSDNAADVFVDVQLPCKEARLVEARGLSANLEKSASR
jgi:hypothetical protein